MHGHRERRFFTTDSGHRPRVSLRACGKLLSIDSGRQAVNNAISLNDLVLILNAQSTEFCCCCCRFKLEPIKVTSKIRNAVHIACHFMFEKDLGKKRSSKNRKDKYN